MSDNFRELRAEDAQNQAGSERRQRMIEGWNLPETINVDSITTPQITTIAPGIQIEWFKSWVTGAVYIRRNGGAWAALL